MFSLKPRLFCYSIFVKLLFLYFRITVLKVYLKIWFDPKSIQDSYVEVIKITQLPKHTFNRDVSCPRNLFNISSQHPIHDDLPEWRVCSDDTAGPGLFIAAYKWPKFTGNKLSSSSLKICAAFHGVFRCPMPFTGHKSLWPLQSA